MTEEREAWRGEPSDLTVGELGGTLRLENDATEQATPRRARYARVMCARYTLLKLTVRIDSTRP